MESSLTASLRVTRRVAMDSVIPSLGRWKNRKNRPAGLFVPTILAIEEEVEIRKSGFKASLAPPQKKVRESPSQKKKKSWMW
jgi:hypothetical protein